MQNRIINIPKGVHGYINFNSNIWQIYSKNDLYETDGIPESYFGSIAERYRDELLQEIGISKYDQNEINNDEIHFVIKNNKSLIGYVRGDHLFGIDVCFID
jgi:hypothetical protein